MNVQRSCLLMIAVIAAMLPVSAQVVFDHDGQVYRTLAPSSDTHEATDTSDYCIWEDETVFGIGKEPGIATYMPYSSEAEMTADSAFYATPWTEPANTRYLSLNGIWKFNFVTESSLRPQDFHLRSFDVSDWDQIMVPGCWEMQGYDRPIYANVEYPHDNRPPYIRARPKFNDGGINYGINPVGSYVMDFEVPQDWRTRRTFLHFDGIYSAANVWVNGNYVGYTQGSNNVAEFDVTQFLDDGCNRLAVQVFRWCDGSYLECQDMFRMSGIFRDVYLYNVPLTSVRDHVITSVISDGFNDAEMNVRLQLDNRSGENVTKNIKVSVYGPEDNEIVTRWQKVQVEPETASCEVNMSFSVADVSLWSAETPSLYTVRVVQQNEQGDDEMAFSTKYGFCDIKIENSLILVNGRRVFFKGVNRHDTDPLTGRTVSVESMLKDVMLMKCSNINTIRTSHYPNHRKMYAMFDHYGLYCVDEADLEDHANQDISDRESWEPAFVDRITRLVTRDRNHPCVVMWSLGNECGGGRNFGPCYDEARRLDSRPVHYEGTRLGKEYGGNAASDVYSKMYPNMDWMSEHADGKDKPMFLCEYAHAMGNAIGNLSEYWEAIEGSDCTIGGCIWDWVDQAIYEPSEIKNGTWHGRIRTGYDFPGPHQGNFCSNGIVLPDRSESPKLMEVKAVYQYVDFDLHHADDDMNSLIVTLRNKYHFTPLDRFDLKSEVVVNGQVVCEHTQMLPAIAPGESGQVEVDSGRIRISKERRRGNEVSLRLYVLRRERSLYADAGHQEAFAHFVLCERQPLEPLPKDRKASGMIVKEHDGVLEVVNGKSKMKFDSNTGRALSLAVDGREMFHDTEGFIFDNYRYIENDKNDRPAYTPDNGLEPSGRISVRKDSDGMSVVETRRAGTLADQEITYILHSSGIVDVKVKIEPHLSDLYRAGVSCSLDSRYENVSYYAYGPYENYSDRMSSVMLGHFTQTVDQMLYPYIKPQSTGNHCGVRELELLDAAGCGFRIEVEGECSFSALRYSDEELMKARHQWELPESDRIVLHLDAAQKGVGNGSCGYRTQTIQEYCVPEEDMTIHLRISGIQGR